MDVQDVQGQVPPPHPPTFSTLSSLSGKPHSLEPAATRPAAVATEVAAVTALSAWNQLDGLLDDSVGCCCSCACVRTLREMLCAIPPFSTNECIALDVGLPLSTEVVCPLKIMQAFVRSPAVTDRVVASRRVRAARTLEWPLECDDSGDWCFPGSVAVCQLCQAGPDELS